MRQVHFITPTKLSLLDISSMGDSKKRDDPTTLGVFDSGFKYSIALLLRDGVDIKVDVFGGKEDRGIWEEDSWEEGFTETFTFGTYMERCGSTGKEKELINITVDTVYHGGAPQSQHEMREPTAPHSSTVKTGFAKALGFNWELWMALREIWSNMLDEKGEVSEESKEIEEGTIITLTFDESNEFYKVWENKHLYINQKEPLHKISNKVEALENEEGYLRIYKQNILVYTDKNIPSRFAYNILFGRIDERRILSDIYSVEGIIMDAIRYTKNEEYLREILLPVFHKQEKEFLSTRSNYYTATDLVHDIAYEVYEEHGQVDSYEWLIESIKKRKDCKIGGKKIQSVEDSLWGYTKTVSIESKPQEYPLTPDEAFSPLQAEINKLYNFELNVEVKRATLKGSKVIADKFEKCLIVDEDFSVENDMADFIVEYLDLTEEGNVIENLAKYILKLIKK